MRILICEDEKQYSNAILSAIQRWQKKNLSSLSIDVYNSSEDMLGSLTKKVVYDLAFLDIHFPGEINGLEVAKELKRINEKMVLVFISNYKEYAIDGYKVNALRFLSKPFSDTQIYECLDIGLHQWKLTADSFLFLENKQQLFKLPYKSIHYIESRAHYLTIHLVNYEKSVLTIRMKLSALMADLPNEIFVQCHQSFIVNLLYIQRITRTQIYLTDTTELPVSLKYRTTVLSCFKAFFQGDAI